MVPRLLAVAALLALAGCTTDTEDVRLEWTEHPELGEILTDAEGNTLYTFANDDGQSSCYDQCAANWPPLLGEAGAAEGVDGNVGSVERDDGTTQVTYEGDPLYYYAGDEEAGDANGHELGDVWFAVSR